MIKYYYLLTAYFPRPLPRTSEEFIRIKEIFIQYYGLEDKPDIWLTVIGHMTSVPTSRLRKSYGNIVNAAKRLRINASLQKEKQVYIKELTDRLEVLAKQVSDEYREEEQRNSSNDNVQEKSHDLSRVVQELSTS